MAWFNSARHQEMIATVRAIVQTSRAADAAADSEHVHNHPKSKRCACFQGRKAGPGCYRRAAKGSRYCVACLDGICDCRCRECILNYYPPPCTTKLDCQSPMRHADTLPDLTDESSSDDDPDGYFLDDDTLCCGGCPETLVEAGEFRWRCCTGCGNCRVTTKEYGDPAGKKYPAGPDQTIVTDVEQLWECPGCELRQPIPTFPATMVTCKRCKQHRCRKVVKWRCEKCDEHLFGQKSAMHNLHRTCSGRKE